MPIFVDEFEAQNKVEKVTMNQQDSSNPLLK